MGHRMEDKRDFLFRFIPPDKRKLLKLDSEAFYSVTDQYTADKISREIKRQFPDIRVITDATACIGGNSYSFSKYFDTVNAIEIDKLKYNYLCENMKVLETENVRCLWGDCIELVPSLHQDLVFLDPPWGGPDYKAKTKISLSLSQIPLLHVCEKLKYCCTYLALKVPVNFDLEGFCVGMDLVYKNTDLRKMQLLIFKLPLVNTP